MYIIYYISTDFETALLLFIIIFTMCVRVVRYACVCVVCFVLCRRHRAHGRTRECRRGGISV